MFITWEGSIIETLLQPARSYWINWGNVLNNVGQVIQALGRQTTLSAVTQSEAQT
jgi:hypothetical protein